MNGESDGNLDRDELLSRAIDALPFTFNVRIHGAVLVLSRPVMPGRELLRLAAGERAIDQSVQQDLARIGREADPYPDQGTPGLGDAYAVRRVGADLWVCENQPNSGPAYEYQARVEITATGELTYWHSPVISSRNDEQGPWFVMERSVTRAVYQPLAAVAWLYEQAGFHGPVDVGVAVLGIEQAGAASLAPNRIHAPTYGAPDYRRHERATTEELSTNLGGLVRRLLAPLYEVISGRDYDPLGDR